MDLQGGSNNEFSPSAESISEFKLQTGMVGAQYGGGATAVANFATKSGTNGLHGSGYWYVQMKRSAPMAGATTRAASSASRTRPITSAIPLAGR